MANQKRIRIFAGPNGSGKTTLVNRLIEEKKFKTKIFVNADNIEKSFVDLAYLDLSLFSLLLNTVSLLEDSILSNGISRTKLSVNDIKDKFTVVNNKLYYSGKMNSYIAADIAAFLRNQLINAGISFVFETVFSHESKLEILKKAKDKGYKVYFYFVTTDDVSINIDRVCTRVYKKGHDVPEEKIKERYIRSLNLLLPAVKLSDEAYLFDHSGKYLELIAHVSNGEKVKITDYDKQYPQWIFDSFYDKLTLKK